ELRDRLLTAADKATAPIMLIQAANDYSTAPGYALAKELQRLHKPHLLKVYPPIGKTAEDGHGFLYLAMPQWEEGVFRFLGEHLKTSNHAGTANSSSLCGPNHFPSVGNASKLGRNRASR